MKKIAILLPALLPVPAVRGGAIETLIEGLIRQNEKTPVFEFTVYSAYDEQAYKRSLDFNYTKFEYVHSSEKIYRVYYLFYRFVKKVFKLAIPDNLARKKMVDRINIDDFDWILYEAGEVFSLLSYYKKLDSRKTLVHAHGMITPIPKVDKCFSYYLSISQFVSEYWANNSSRSKKTYIVWKNCIQRDNFTKKLDKESVEGLKKKLGIHKSDFVIIFTGRIIPEKGVLELLKAMSYLKDDKIKLIVIGSANFAENTATAYEKLVRNEKEKLGDKVIFTGFVHNTELYKYYQLADIAVVPSMWDEPAGLVVIEAMAAGKPIITTGSGGIKEYITDNAALYIDRSKDVAHQIADKIRYLLEKPDEREKMSLAAIKHSEQYDMRNYLERLEEIISDIESMKG